MKGGSHENDHTHYCDSIGFRAHSLSHRGEGPDGPRYGMGQGMMGGWGMGWFRVIFREKRSKLES